MSTEGIKAGRTYVELYLKDQLPAGLAAAQRRLATWSKGLATFGGSLLGGASTILAPLTAAVASFTSSGSQLADMSAATGVSVEELSALGYAAKQTGTGLEALNAGLRGMAKFTAQVKAGNKGAVAALNELGISAAAFLKATPTQRLGMIADGLLKIQDPSLRTAAAMKALGKGGVELMSMLSGGSAGLKAFVDRAKELGLVITGEEAAKADELGDAWDDVVAVFNVIAFKTGAALADTLTALLRIVISCGVAVSDFVANNQLLVLSLAIGAVTVGGLGVAFLIAAGAGWALSATLAGLSAMVTFFTGVTTACAAVLGFLVTPLGLVLVSVAAVAVGLAAGAILFLKYTAAGQQMASVLTGLFFGLLGTAQQTFKGIFDAIVGGNWNLAAAIAMAGLNVAWQQGIAALKTLWIDFRNWLIGLMADLGASVVQQFATMQQKIVAGINAIRSQVGLEPIKGFAVFDEAAKRAGQLRDGIKGAAAGSRDGEVAALQKPVTDAQRALTALAAAATALRAGQAKRRKDRLKDLFDDSLGSLPGGAGGKDLVNGTFSGFAAPLLARSTPVEHHQKKTAENTEAMKKHLEKIEALMEDNGGLLSD